MVTDTQVRRLRKFRQTTKTQDMAAAKAEMDVKTARKYCRLGQLPSDVKVAHTWRTRPNPFVEVGGEVESYLALNPGLEAKTVFEYLQRTYPGRFADGQLRSSSVMSNNGGRWQELRRPSFFPRSITLACYLSQILRL